VVRSHFLPERRVSDAFVNVVLAEIALPLLRVKAKRSYLAAKLRELCAGAGLTSCLNPNVHRRDTLHPRAPGRRRDRGLAPDEGAALVRSVVHGFGWGIGHEIATAFSATEARASPATDPKNAAPCEVRAPPRAESTRFSKGLCALSGCGTPTNVLVAVYRRHD
jgi:hypothetical protein